VWNSPGPRGKHPGPVDNKILFFRNKIKWVRFDQKHPESKEILFTIFGHPRGSDWQLGSDKGGLKI
jgi:hypothetical protein